ncbi:MULTISPECIES: polysaccharide biosynthesis C-terminal domain-containing protein [Leuconostoc]|uniref:polysaccharide biosynthesis C-terminal domain-containing protein n=1 Tax=Leuconostoc TaxID=1243 RepID=UPI001C7DE95D|nr:MULTISPECIES: polysaccharide biosynthesis C-terminal domain-containing protein [Leuconostoc]
MNLMRQSVAMVLVYLGASFLFDSRWSFRKSFTISLVPLALATTFHRTSVVAVAIWFVYLVFKNAGDNARRRFGSAVFVGTAGLILSFLIIKFGVLNSLPFMIKYTSYLNGDNYLVTATTSPSRLLLTIVLRLGLTGFLLSMVIALVVSAIYLSVFLKVWRHFSLRFVDFTMVKKMLAYSIPLIPNTLSWWLSSASSRIFVVTFAGVAANGLFAAANKLPSIVSILYSIFTQAWQMSAVEEFEDEKGSKFYSNILDLTIRVLTIGIVFLIVFNKFIVHLLLSQAYFLAWTIVPWLAVSVLYTSIASFLGTIYVAALKTKGVLYTTIFGAIINVALNLILTKSFGAVGAAISTSVAFLLLSVVRFFDTQKFMKIKVNWKYLAVSHLAFLMAFVANYIHSPQVTAVLSLVSILLIIVTNKKLLTTIVGSMNKFITTKMSWKH